jgi:phospholipid/cholesterol/gamma-HCH transport system ATP-binding protein
MFQDGALFGSMSLYDNTAFPLREHTKKKESEIRNIVMEKLELVGLGGEAAKFPGEISGGMRKRAGLARAMALDPEILFFDEPSAGLDPISSRMLDDLILELRDSLGATIVIVSHELPSIFTIANNSIFLDAETHTAIASGDPHELLAHSTEPRVRMFLTRGAAGAAAER